MKVKPLCLTLLMLSQLQVEEVTGTTCFHVKFIHVKPWLQLYMFYAVHLPYCHRVGYGDDTPL